MLRGLILLKPSVSIGFLWRHLDKWKGGCCRVTARFPPSLSLTRRDTAPCYCWERMGVLASYQPSTDTSLAGRAEVPCYHSHLASLTPWVACGRRVGLSLLGGDGSPDSSLHLFWQNPRGEEKRYFITVRRGWESRLPTWKCKTPLVLCIDGFRVTVFICGVLLENSSFCLNVLCLVNLPLCWFFGQREQDSLSVPVVVSGLLSSLAPTLRAMRKENPGNSLLCCSLGPEVPRQTASLPPFRVSLC